jgi:hypothetical protein
VPFVSRILTYCVFNGRLLHFLDVWESENRNRSRSATSHLSLRQPVKTKNGEEVRPLIKRGRSVSEERASRPGSKNPKKTRNTEGLTFGTADCHFMIMFLLNTPLVLACFLLASECASQTQGEEQRRLDFVPLGLQSGPDTGHSVASAIRVHNGAAWIIGSTQGNWFQPNTPASSVSGCFLAQVAVPSSSSNGDTSSRGWTTRVTIDNPDSEEDCNNLSFVTSTRMIISGHAEPGGILSGLYNSGGYTVVDHFGTLLDLNVDTSNDALPSLYGGYLLDQMTANYPMSTVIDSSDPPNIYVLSMETDKVDPSDTVYKVIPVDWLTINDPQEFFLTGMSFSMVVTKVTPRDVSSLTLTDQELDKSLSSSWRIPFTSQYGRTVHTAGIDKIRDGSLEVLVVAGTTAGHGTVFGKESSSDETTDLDGFVSRLSMSTGRLESTPLSRRIGSVNGRDDWIGAICVHGSDIYIAGSTRGDMLNDVAETNNGVDAFLIKLDGRTLETVWTYQLGAQPREADSDPATATGVACAVTPDGQNVYLAGNVKSDAVLDLAGTISSYGDDDVYVVQLTSDTGKVNFVRQIGSEDRDAVAFRHGLAVDEDGNAVLTGSTFGSFYRQRTSGEESVSDIFVVTVSKFNGALATPLSQPEFIGKETGTTGSGSAVPGSEEPSPEPSSAETSTSQKAGIGVGVFFMFFIGAMLAIYCCFFAGREKPGAVETDRSRVLRYLSNFDVEDVDLKHSATGGWHCSYAGPLANGIVNSASHSRYRDQPQEGDEDPEEPIVAVSHLSAPLTGTADLHEDSLYFEEHQDPPLISSSEKVQGSRRKEYYNSSILDSGWEDERVSGVVEASQPSTRRGGWGRDII